MGARLQSDYLVYEENVEIGNRHVVLEYCEFVVVESAPLGLVAEAEGVAQAPKRCYNLKGILEVHSQTASQSCFQIVVVVVVVVVVPAAFCSTS